MQTKIFGTTSIVCIILITKLLLTPPGTHSTFLVPAAIFIACSTAAIYYACPFRSWTGAYVLLAAFTATYVGIILNINFFTHASGGDFAHPVLHNWDASNDWQRAVALLEGKPADGLAVRYLSTLCAGLMWLFGRDIAVPLMFNLLCYMLVIISVGGITWLITSERRSSNISMLICLCMCYLMEQATVFIKDVPVTCTVALICLLFINWYKRDRKDTPAWQYAAMCVLIAAIGFLRLNFLPMLMLGALLFGVGLQPLKFDMRFAGIFIAAATFYAIAPEIIKSPAAIGDYLSSDTAVYPEYSQAGSAAWDRITGDYKTLSIWQRLLWLPVSTAVQFIIPLPWTYANHTQFGVTAPLAHFGFFWYFAAALVIFRIFADYNKNSPAMKRLLAWGVALTLWTAFATGGHVSRYCLPYLPMLLPAAAMVLAHDMKRRSLHIWLAVFTALLALALFICHSLQSPMS